MGQHLLNGNDGRYLVRTGWDSFYQPFFLEVIDTLARDYGYNSEYR